MRNESCTDDSIMAEFGTLSVSAVCASRLDLDSESAHHLSTFCSSTKFSSLMRFGKDGALADDNDNEDEDDDST